MLVVYIVTGAVIGIGLFLGVFLLRYYSRKNKIRKLIVEYNKYILQKYGGRTSSLSSVGDL